MWPRWLRSCGRRLLQIFPGRNEAKTSLIRDRYRPVRCPGSPTLALKGGMAGLTISSVVTNTAAGTRRLPSHGASSAAASARG